MDHLAEKLKRDLQKAAHLAGVEGVRVLRMSSVGDQQIIASFHLAVSNYGLFVASRGLIALCTVLTDSMIDEAVERASSAMAWQEKLLGELA